jgi:hypothetical protein
MELQTIYDANDDKHKYVAVFKTPTGFKHVKFGAWGYEDYTEHKNAERKRLYLLRHQTNEDWNNPLTKGALSRWILWNKPSLINSIHDFKKRFNL